VKNKFDALLKTENPAELEKLNDQLESNRTSYSVAKGRSTGRKKRARKKWFLISLTS